MIASFVQGPVPRLLLVGVLVVALQQTLFTELRPADVTVQIVLALAAAAGAGGGSQKGALAGFVLGLMFDLRVGSPLGSSSLTMGLAGFSAGYVTSITVDPQWWLAGLFTGLGSGIGEAIAPLIRVFIGEEYDVTFRLPVVVAVVAGAALVLSPVLVPIGRWCMKVKRTDWTRVSTGGVERPGKRLEPPRSGPMLHP